MRWEHAERMKGVGELRLSGVEMTDERRSEPPRGGGGPGRGKPVWAWVPGYGWACFAAGLTVQLLSYYGARVLTAGRELHLLEGPFDELIPLVPAWIVAYVAVFALWAASGLWILSESKERSVHFLCIYVIAMVLAFLILVIYPGTMTRPEVTGSDVFSRALAWIYTMDEPTNLCPSLHVLITYLCWRGCFGSRIIPRWYRRLNGVSVVLTCLSILFVKQHVLIDIPVAFAVGEAAVQAARLLGPERLLKREH